MHTMNPELSHSSYSLFNYIALWNANTTIPGARSSVRSLEFRPRQLAHVFQYTDFFTYNCCRANILTYGKQLHYRLTDAILR